MPVTIFLFGSRRWRYTRSPAAQANDWCDAESGEDLRRPVDADGLYQEVQQQAISVVDASNLNKRLSR